MITVKVFGQQHAQEQQPDYGIKFNNSNFKRKIAPGSGGCSRVSLYIFTYLSLAFSCREFVIVHDFGRIINILYIQPHLMFLSFKNFCILCLKSVVNNCLKNYSLDKKFSQKKNK